MHSSYDMQQRPDNKFIIICLMLLGLNILTSRNRSHGILHSEFVIYHIVKELTLHQTL